MTPLDLFKQRSTEPWLIGVDQRQVLELAQERLDHLQAGVRSPDQPTSRPIIFLAEREPSQFLAHFLAACSCPSVLFLCNPDWGAQEWQQLNHLVQPSDLWGTVPPPLRKHASSILIPTGGTSGQLRFAVHTWETLRASVLGMQAHFAVDRIHSLCVLPLYHVSGLMQFLRSLITGGQLCLQDWKSLESGELPPIAPEEFFLSLVPTQLQRLMQSPIDSSFLRSLRAILLGGAPAWDGLLREARSRQWPIAPTYGMTETASQVATLKPAEFLAGKTGAGRPLPHAQIMIQSAAGDPLPAGSVGTIAIQARSRMVGYFPDRTIASDADSSDPAQFIPDDVGYLDEAGYLHLLGRASDKIITGGENVFPAEVEAVIRSTPWVQDVCVLGLDDPTWGQQVAAAYVPRQPEMPVEELQRAIAGQLSRYKQPKKWIALDQLPRNPQGKINRAFLRSLIVARLGNPANPATISSEYIPPDH
ncbi:2-succinylbenzoate--CoA ligase [Alkalinema pantanalense CENA528]|uniref:2-succinylbenzoate--CoA ligase n=1 Tax=Alkalinema pantanalense TaxID=1620705 RepID=UPI003D6F879E